MRRTLSALGTGLVVAATVLSTTSSASAAAPYVVASYAMNEAPGATVMQDGTGHGLSGRIGSSIRVGTAGLGAVGYQFPFRNPTAPPAEPERLATVPDDARLDPGTRNYTVEFRYRTERPFGNIVQKGQAGSPGGYWKFQAPHGVISCLFRGSQGGLSVNSGRPINDGQWHTVRCTRTPTGLTLTVTTADGLITRGNKGTTGSISNPAPLSIGGKSNCNQRTVTCDYFSGIIDYVKIIAG